MFHLFLNIIKSVEMILNAFVSMIKIISAFVSQITIVLNVSLTMVLQVIIVKNVYREENVSKVINKIQKISFVFVHRAIKDINVNSVYNHSVLLSIHF